MWLVQVQLGQMLVSHVSRCHRLGGSVLAIAAMLAALALAPSSAHAQGPSSYDPTPDTESPFLNAQPIERATKQWYSPSRARWLPVVGTLGALGLMGVGSGMESPVVSGIGAIGFMLAPHFGHFYTRDWKRALGLMGLRAGGLMLTGIGMVGVMAGGGDCFGECSRSSMEEVAPLLLIGGLVGFLGGTVYSYWDAGNSARRANARRSRMMLAPTPMAGVNGSRGYGLSLTGRF